MFLSLRPCPARIPARISGAACRRAPCAAARAATAIWTGSADQVNWSAAGNWADTTGAALTAPPGAADDAMFFDSANLSPSVDAGFGGALGSLRLGGTNSDYTITIARTKP